jgi:hypothetical protein
MSGGFFIQRQCIHFGEDRKIVDQALVVLELNYAHLLSKGSSVRLEGFDRSRTLVAVLRQ